MRQRWFTLTVLLLVPARAEWVERTGSGMTRSGIARMPNGWRKHGNPRNMHSQSYEATNTGSVCGFDTYPQYPERSPQLHAPTPMTGTCCGTGGAAVWRWRLGDTALVLMPAHRPSHSAVVRQWGRTAGSSSPSACMHWRCDIPRLHSCPHTGPLIQQWSASGAVPG